MKNLFSILAAGLLLASTATLVSCDKDDNDDDRQGFWSGSDLKGSVSAPVSLDPSTTYTLSAPLFVKSGGELTIPAGTTIKAAAGDNYILVEMGGKIFINGTSSKPVIMTAAVPNAGPGYWGGLVINGRAPLAGGETNVDTEINANYKYGGSDANDDSGDISYLVLEYTGYAISASVEHNGLTLNAVGKGTSIQNVFIPNGGDDGIEFFGGSVDVTGLLVVNSDDDMFDFTRGYTGTLKDAYGIWESGYTSSEEDPNGIEADGNFDGNSASHTAQSNFTVTNITFDFRNAYVSGDNTRRAQSGMRLRRHTDATITNALFKGTGRVETLINLSDSKGGADKSISVSVTNSLTTPPDNLFRYSEPDTAADFPGVQIVSGNTGCATSVFSWTGYSF